MPTNRKLQNVLKESTLKGTTFSFILKNLLIGEFFYLLAQPIYLYEALINGDGVHLYSDNDPKLQNLFCKIIGSIDLAFLWTHPYYLVLLILDYCFNISVYASTKLVRTTVTWNLTYLGISTIWIIFLFLFCCTYYVHVVMVQQDGGKSCVALWYMLLIITPEDEEVNRIINSMGPGSESIDPSSVQHLLMSSKADFLVTINTLCFTYFIPILLLLCCYIYYFKIYCQLNHEYRNSLCNRNSSRNQSSSVNQRSTDISRNSSLPSAGTNDLNKTNPRQMSFSKQMLRFVFRKRLQSNAELDLIRISNNNSFDSDKSDNLNNTRSSNSNSRNSKIINYNEILYIQHILDFILFSSITFILLSGPRQFLSVYHNIYRKSFHELQSSKPNTVQILVNASNLSLHLFALFQPVLLIGFESSSRVNIIYHIFNALNFFEK